MHLRYGSVMSRYIVRAFHFLAMPRLKLGPPQQQQQQPNKCCQIVEHFSCTLYKCMYYIPLHIIHSIPGYDIASTRSHNAARFELLILLGYDDDDGCSIVFQTIACITFSDATTEYGVRVRATWFQIYNFNITLNHMLLYYRINRELLFITHTHTRNESRYLSIYASFCIYSNTIYAAARTPILSSRCVCRPCMLFYTWANFFRFFFVQMFD